jgi:hypothetical protein
MNKNRPPAGGQNKPNSKPIKPNFINYFDSGIGEGSFGKKARKPVVGCSGSFPILIGCRNGHKMGKALAFC